MSDRKNLSNARLVAAIAIGVFLVGLGVGYGVFLSTPPQQQQLQATTAAQSQTLMAQGYRAMTQGANTMLQGQEMMNQGKVEEGYVTMLEGSNTMELGRNMMGQGFDGFGQMQNAQVGGGMMGGGGMMMQNYNSMMSSMSSAVSNADSMMDARSTMMSGADMAREGSLSEGMGMMSQGAGSMTASMEMMQQNMMTSGAPAQNAGMMMSSGMMQQMMGSMMGNVYTVNGPLTFDNVKKEAANYVSSLNNPDLAVRDVMEFQYNYYFIVYEESTDTGAFEMIVMKDNDASGTAMMMTGIAGVMHPEPGPNMMWNTKYGMMTGPSASQVVKAQDMSISSDSAKQIAQQYLDTYMPGEEAEDVETFYGYYTIHSERDGRVTGMLSVNGFSGQVWFHSWHGEFIMSEEEHE